MVQDVGVSVRSSCVIWTENLGIQLYVSTKFNPKLLMVGGEGRLGGGVTHVTLTQTFSIKLNQIRTS